MKIAGALLCVLLVSGCRTAPWPPVTAVPAAEWDAEAVRGRFAAALAPRFEMMNSVVFSLGRMRLAGIGLVSVDRTNNALRLTCLTPLGVKLFDVSGRDGAAECRFAMAGLGPTNEAARAVAEDVQRVYFDLTPSPSATVAREKSAMVFTERAGDGLLEYVFAGAEQRLVEKRFQVAGRVVWEIFYGPYRLDGGHLVPVAVLLRNRRHGYSLLVRPLLDS